MRLYVLLGVDVGLILLATQFGFVLRENFEVTQVDLRPFFPIFARPLLCRSFAFRLLD